MTQKLYRSGNITILTRIKPPKGGINRGVEAFTKTVAPVVKKSMNPRIKAVVIAGAAVVGVGAALYAIFKRR